MAGSRQRLGLKLANISFVTLFLAVIAILMWITTHYRTEFDWTATGRNTLSAPSIALLHKLHKPILIRAFVADNHSMRGHIRRLIGRYRRVKHDVRLQFVNPNKHPQRARKAGIQFEGELQIVYDRRTQMVTELTEQAVTNALAGLGRSGLRQVTFLGGNGERDPNGTASYDLSAWARQLKARGFKITSDTLTAPSGLSPDDSLLVITSPKVNLLPGQVQQIRQFVTNGGNLLWLQDPGPLHGLRPLADRLGVQFMSGMVVDPTSQLLTGQANFIAMLHYGPNPVVRGLHLITVLPVARGILTRQVVGWHTTTLLDTDPNAWVATGPVHGVVRFRKGQDIPGPIVLGVTLQRDHARKRQRVAIIGNGNFVANAFLGEAGNLDLAMNLVNWATHEDAYINIPSQPTPDLHLVLSRGEQTWIALLFLIVLPLLLVLNGAGIWWRRRRL